MNKNEFNQIIMNLIKKKIIKNEFNQIIMNLIKLKKMN